jgi:hypothetical protein
MAGCKLLSIIHVHIEYNSDDRLFKKKLKERLLIGCYYFAEEYVNDDFSHTGTWYLFLFLQVPIL